MFGDSSCFRAFVAGDRHWPEPTSYVIFISSESAGPRPRAIDRKRSGDERRHAEQPPGGLRHGEEPCGGSDRNDVPALYWIFFANPSSA
jgi:hypothetical protein